MTQQVSSKTPRIRSLDTDQFRLDFSVQFVEKEIRSGNISVPGDYEISPGAIWRFARAARDPFKPPAIARLLAMGEPCISTRMIAFKRLSIS
jgi:hypothetical protein